MPGYELIGSEELSEINDIFDNGGILFRHSFDNLRGSCYKVKEFEKQFSSTMNCPFALAVTSGTAALRVALSTLNLKTGDEVITQSFTFVATVEAIIESRATPVCAEIDETLNLDPISLEESINENTKAVIVVHMLGTPARLVEIKNICDKHNITMIEDTAWGCGGKLENKYLGTWGRMGTFSFDFAKTITTGEGGMILFQNESDYKKAAAWHDHGHENNPKVPRWEDTRKGSGFNYRMNELQGAVGIAQLKKLSKIISAQIYNRKKIWDSLSDIKGLILRESPKESFETADALIFKVENSSKALSCRNELLKENISTKILPEATTWHFAGYWNHMPELISKHKNLSKSFLKSKAILECAVSIPILVNMPDDVPKKIRKAITCAIK